MSDTTSAVAVRAEYIAAAGWWADRLVRPGKQDNGDGFQSGFATALMLTAMMSNDPPTLNDDERARFIEALAARLVASGRWAIGVDYHPDEALTDALTAAVGVERARRFDLIWPIK